MRIITEYNEKTEESAAYAERNGKRPTKKMKQGAK